MQINTQRQRDTETQRQTETDTKTNRKKQQSREEKNAAQRNTTSASILQAHRDRSRDKRQETKMRQHRYERGLELFRGSVKQVNGLGSVEWLYNNGTAPCSN